MTWVAIAFSRRIPEITMAAYRTSLLSLFDLSKTFYCEHQWVSKAVVRSRDMCEPSPLKMLIIEQQKILDAIHLPTLIWMIKIGTFRIAIDQLVNSRAVTSG